jgi:hypothetical protein
MESDDLILEDAGKDKGHCSESLRTQGRILIQALSQDFCRKCRVGRAVK